MRQWVLLIVPENPFHQIRSNEHGLPFNTLRLSLSFPSWWERNVRSVIIARLKIQQLPVLHLGGWTRYFSFTTSKWLLLHLCLNRVLIFLWLIHRLMMVCSYVIIPVFTVNVRLLVVHFFISIFTSPFLSLFKLVQWNFLLSWIQCPKYVL